MKVKAKRTPEGVVVANELSDETTVAQRMLQKCKEMERSKKLVPVAFGNKTYYMIPAGTDIEKWKERKTEALSRQRNGGS